MPRDSSTAPLLDLRRRLRAVKDVLGGIIRGGVTLSGSLELTVQRERILRRAGEFCDVVEDLHRRL